MFFCCCFFNPSLLDYLFFPQRKGKWERQYRRASARLCAGSASPEGGGHPRAMLAPAPDAERREQVQKKKPRLRLYNLLFFSAYKIWLRLLVSTTISGTTRSHFQPIHIGAVIARISVSVKFFNQVFFEQSLDCLVHGFLFPDSAPACDIFPRRKSHIAFPVHTTTKKTIDGDVPRLQTLFKDSVVNHKEVFSFVRHIVLLSRCVFDIILQKYCVVNSHSQKYCIYS